MISATAIGPVTGSNNAVIDNLRTKKYLNYSLHGTAAAANLITFINGNRQFLAADNETLGVISGMLSRLSTGVVRGLVLFIDALEKKNPVATAGFFLELPTALFSSDYNYWVNRGIPQALGQFQGVFDRWAYKVNGETQKIIQQITEEDKVKEEEKIVTISDLMNGNDWFDNLKISWKESIKITKEVVKNPKIITERMEGGLYLASLTQFTGTVVNSLGAEKSGSLIRDLAGIGVDLSLTRDNKKGSLFPLAGYTWITAAVADFAKRFEFIDTMIPNLTNLSLASDLLAALIYSHENLNIQSNKSVTLTEKSTQDLKKLKENYFTMAA